jgi:hypothetical protein
MNLACNPAWKGFSYACPHCHAILGVQINPLTQLRFLRLPPVIELRVDCPQGRDLSELIFRMRVTAGTKNPYYIHFPKTSVDGTTRITAEDFRGQFRDYDETMECHASLELARDVVGIELFDPQPMMERREMLLSYPQGEHERTVWRSREDFIDYYLSCRNREFYLFEHSACIPQDGLIRLTVQNRCRSGT